MNLSIRGVLLWMIGVTYLPLVYANADLSLEQQVEDLSKRVVELERRLNALESPELKQVIEQVSAPVNPGHSDDQSNWNRLKVGYNHDEVRELLGEPVRIKKGGMEFWYYSDVALKGPFVKFLFGKVNDWKGPEE